MKSLEETKKELAQKALIDRSWHELCLTPVLELMAKYDELVVESEKTTAKEKLLNNIRNIIGNL